jgi:epoxyqueuosine reductase
MRTKRRGLQRNSCVAAGNSGDKTMIPVLKNFIKNTDDLMLKEHANWALMKLYSL